MITVNTLRYLEERMPQSVSVETVQRPDPAQEAPVSPLFPSPWGSRFIYLFFFFFIYFY